MTPVAESRSVSADHLLVLAGVHWSTGRDDLRRWSKSLPQGFPNEYQPVSKQYTQGVKTRDYGLAMLWTAFPSEEVTNTTDLVDLLQELTSMRHAILVFGQLTAAGAAHADAMPRTHVGTTDFVDGTVIAPTLEDRPVRILALDVDKWALPREGMTPTERARDLADRVRQRAPWLADAELVIQMSASYGFAHGLHKAHCFVLLEDPRTQAQIKQRLEQDGFFTGAEVFDRSLYTPSQPLYASAPECVDCKDPLPDGRVFLVEGLRKRVLLPLPDYDSSPIATSVRRPAKGKAAGVDGPSGPAVKGIQPKKKDLEHLASKLLASSEGSKTKIGAALANIVAHRDYAEHGHHREVELSLSMLLFLRFGNHFDGGWFADEYLVPAWTDAKFSDIHNRKRPEWLRMCISARAKTAEVGQTRSIVLSPEVLQQTVLSHRGTFYVAEVDAPTLRLNHAGPFTSQQLPEAIRDRLHNVRRADVWETNRYGELVPRPLSKLKLDLCTNIDAVHFWGFGDPSRHDPERSELNVRVYRENIFTPTPSAICDDFLRAWAGDTYDRVVTYLSLFPDLSRPLVALAVVGNRSTYKSWVTSQLARTWGDPLASNPTLASKFFQRFNDTVLRSPVIWHNERIVSGPEGKPDPRGLRDAISEVIHVVEGKFVTPVLLHTALRHVATANHEDIIHEGFAGGTSDAEAQATRDRYLVLTAEQRAIEAWRKRWMGTPAFEQFHESREWRERWSEEEAYADPNLLLRHVAALRAEHLPQIYERERNGAHERFGVPSTITEMDVKRHKYQDRLLSNVVMVAVKSTLRALDYRGVAAPERAIKVISGQVLVRASLITQAWRLCPEVGDARAPDAALVGRTLRKAGLTVERANNHAWGVPVQTEELRQWFDVMGEHVDLSWHGLRLALLWACAEDIGGPPITDPDELAWLRQCEVWRKDGAFGMTLEVWSRSERAKLGRLDR